MRKRIITLEEREAHPDASVEELARVVLARFGLLPKKIDGTAKLEKLLLELNERKKMAYRDKNPEIAVVPVEEMGLIAGIARQTVYDHLGRWLFLEVLKKTSFVSNGRVVIGYELNGPTLEAALKKAEAKIQYLMKGSFDVVEQLKSKIKSEKIKAKSNT